MGNMGNVHIMITAWGILGYDEKARVYVQNGMTQQGKLVDGVTKASWYFYA